MFNPNFNPTQNPLEKVQKKLRKAERELETCESELIDLSNSGSQYGDALEQANHRANLFMRRTRLTDKIKDLQEQEDMLSQSDSAKTTPGSLNNF